MTHQRRRQRAVRLANGVPHQSAMQLVSSLCLHNYTPMTRSHRLENQVSQMSWLYELTLYCYLTTVGEERCVGSAPAAACGVARNVR